jgi:hypothetical protein
MGVYMSAFHEPAKVYVAVWWWWWWWWCCCCFCCLLSQPLWLEMQAAGVGKPVMSQVLTWNWLTEYLSSNQVQHAICPRLIKQRTGPLKGIL